MFTVELPFVVNLLHVFLIWLPYVFKPFVTIPCAPIITGLIVCLTLHISCCLYVYRSSSVHASFCVKFLSACIATSIVYRIAYFLYSSFLIILSGLRVIISLLLSVHSITVSCLYVQLLGLGLCVCPLFVVLMLSA